MIYYSALVGTLILKSTEMSQVVVGTATCLGPLVGNGPAFSLSSEDNANYSREHEALLGKYRGIPCKQLGREPCEVCLPITAGEENGLCVFLDSSWTCRML